MSTKAPLPDLESPQFQEPGLHESPKVVSAYRMILHAEAEANAQKADEKVVLARVVGHLLLELCVRRHILGDQPYKRIVDGLVSPTLPIDNEDDLVFERGRQYRDGLIRGVSTKQYTPPSSHPSRAPYDNLAENVREFLEPTGKDYRTARKKALARDGFRCVITGFFDATSLQSNTELQRQKTEQGGVTIPITPCHILNESTTQGTGTNEKGTVVNKTHYTADIMGTLKMFGLGDLADALLAVNGVHAIWNMLSLEHNTRSFFDDLELWFNSTDTLHRYEVCVSDGDIEKYIRRISSRPGTSTLDKPLIVEFRSDLELAPAPDPKLLALHATCARIAHMSGAAEFFDKLEWDAEETEVLASDGSSAQLLSNLLSPHALIHGFV